MKPKNVFQPYFAHTDYDVAREFTLTFACGHFGIVKLMPEWSERIEEMRIECEGKKCPKCVGKHEWKHHYYIWHYGGTHFKWYWTGPLEASNG